jgi:hypothetical protein
MPTKAIDELIDSGKIEEVYRAIGCKNPKHDPTRIEYVTLSVPKSKCDGCCLLKLEAKDYYFDAAIPVPGEIPGVESGFVDVMLQKDTRTERHCLAKDYISARGKFVKGLENVFPSTV